MPVRQVGLSVIAGEEGPPGNATTTDGTGRAAGLVARAIALDADGHAWVGGGTFLGGPLRRVSPAGVVSTPPVNGPSACSGGADDLAVAADGSLYFLAQAGLCKRSPDGTASLTAQVPDWPAAVATGPAGEVYVANGTGSLYRLGAQGPEVIAGGFQPIVSIAVDAAGTIYVADYGGVHAVNARGERRLLVQRTPTEFMHRMTVEPAGNLIAVAENTTPGTSRPPVLRRITPAGQVSPVAGADNLFRWGTSVDVAVDRQGNILYTSGQGVGRLASDGTHTAVAGHGLAGPHAPLAETPVGTDASGVTWTLSDLAPYLSSDNPAQPQPRLRKLDAAGHRVPFGADGQGLVISERPTSTAMDNEGNLVLVFARFVPVSTGLPIVARGAPLNTEIYRVAPNGAISRLYRRDANEADFVSVVGFGIDAQGRMIVGDAVTNTVRWLRADGSSERIGPGLFTQVNNPALMAVAPSGRVALWDRQALRLHRLDADGILRLWTGQGFQTDEVTDGPATAARISRMTSLAFDSAGQFWFADRNTLRTVSEDGHVGTVVGRPDAFWNSPGPLPGTIAFPDALQAGPNRSLVLRSGGAILKVVPP
ncbi:hypothetical protein FN976_13000 [Caenimonas sedimenti]|uniref:SMP-30/Gluconolactonase/LRE-like region domain-containing protein n=1 Tax=Caenimonas sedimenti TaxID=2596921 RepID=A0A562ZRE2_9BURK|nr:hypothetical protein [Caenimonas sedimenti]TWO70875.1 hypothetical protein FN976_13000 [Caenimonas sedimenti]